MFIACSVAWTTYAAPFPGAGSSALVAPEKGLFWMRQGFQLNTAQTGWQIVSVEEQGEERIRYQRPSTPTASMGVRIESLKADLTLENYAKRWMRDYINYGFDVLGTRAFTQNEAKGLVVDLIHRKSNQQLRQVLFLKDKKVVVLTCRDQQKTFSQTLIGCNEISKSFAWANPNSQTTF